MCCPVRPVFAPVGCPFLPGVSLLPAAGRGTLGQGPEMSSSTGSIEIRLTAIILEIQKKEIYKLRGLEWAGETFH